MKKLFWIFLIGAAFSGTGVFAQKEIDQALNILANNFPQEKLYLHFDKEAYNPGETIWFKAYLYSGLLPSPYSKTVYFELTDRTGKVIERKVAPVFSGGAAAAFDIPGDIRESMLYVRAYTAWMLNFDSSFLYAREIPLLNVTNPNPAPQVKEAFILEFFPEGGDLVENLESRVAFKGRDARGLPIDIHAVIKNNKGEKIAEISPVHNGMGTFRMTPKTGEVYTAEWTDPKGKKMVTPLPKAEKSGVVLEVNRSGDFITFRIERPENSKGESFFIAAQMQHILLYRAKANLEQNTSITGNIPISELPTGIIQITVFTEKLQPLAERVIFVRPNDYYFITDLTYQLKAFTKRGRNVIQIDVSDTVETNLSISVTDADLNPPVKGAEDIYSGLLLSADIKGYIHQPGYYFTSDVDSVQRHLDLVMLTNGWRRFRWEDVLANKWPEIKYLPEDYITVNGSVTGLPKQSLSRQQIIGIMEVEGKQELLNIPLDSTGKFYMPGMVFYDTAKIYYQFNNDKDRILTSTAIFTFENSMLKISPKYIDSVVLNKASAIEDAVAERNKEVAERMKDLFADKKVQELETVTVTAKVKSKAELLDEEYTSGLFKSGNARVFAVEDDLLANASLSVLNYLQGRVPGLQIVVDGGGNASMTWRGGNPSLYLNEMLSDAQVIQSIPMSDVALIKVFPPPFFGGGGAGAGGAIAVYTKKGRAVDPEFKGLDFAKIPGYSPVRQFYSPDYSIYNEEHTQPDYRSTLYWNPFIVTNKKNKRVIINFYNNDITKRIRVVIEGIAEDGRITRTEKIFE